MAESLKMKGSLQTKSNRKQSIEEDIIKLFQVKAGDGLVMLTIPDVIEGLKIDRRKIENALTLLAKGKKPQLVEVPKGRLKLYVLKEIVDFAKKKMG